MIFIDSNKRFLGGRVNELSEATAARNLTKYSLCCSIGPLGILVGLFAQLCWNQHIRLQCFTYSLWFTFQKLILLFTCLQTFTQYTRLWLRLHSWTFIFTFVYFSSTDSLLSVLHLWTHYWLYFFSHHYLENCQILCRYLLYSQCLNRYHFFLFHMNFYGPQKLSFPFLLKLNIPFANSFLFHPYHMSIKFPVFVFSLQPKSSHISCWFSCRIRTHLLLPFSSASIFVRNCISYFSFLKFSFQIFFPNFLKLSPLRTDMLIDYRRPALITFCYLQILRSPVNTPHTLFVLNI